MGAAAVFLGALLTGLYLSNAAHYKRSSLETAHEALLEGGRARGGMPVVVAESGPGDRVFILSNQIYFLGEEEVAAAVAEAEALGAGTGELPRRNLRFLCRETGPGRRRWAFVDTYGEKASLRAQAISSLLIGALAFLGFWGLSMVLSRWMVRPVAQAWEKQRQFVADASHELKTPLTVALSNVDMALSAGESDTGSRNRRRLDITKIELLRMKGLVEKLLLLARADAQEGRAAKPIGEADLTYLLACSLLSFEPLFFEAGRQLQSSVAPGCRTAGDPARLSELFGILLDNACKYSLPGSRVDVRLESKSGGTLLTVENDCAPIPADSLPHLFDRFYRLDASRGDVSGYGLGLSIAKEIAAQHGGKIWAGGGGGHIAFYVLL